VEDKLKKNHAAYRENPLIGRRFYVNAAAFKTGNHAKRVRELLDLTHLSASVMQRRPSDLSGRQKQRVNLARAAKPDLLLRDEATLRA